MIKVQFKTYDVVKFKSQDWINQQQLEFNQMYGDGTQVRIDGVGISQNMKRFFGEIHTVSAAAGVKFNLENGGGFTFSLGMVESINGIPIIAGDVGGYVYDVIPNVQVVKEPGITVFTTVIKDTNDTSKNVLIAAKSLERAQLLFEESSYFFDIYSLKELPNFLYEGDECIIPLN